MTAHISNARDMKELHCAFLSLPAELRNRIYDFVAVADLQTFADRMIEPSLLKASRQIREEYSDIFFSNSALKFDAYQGAVNSWHHVEDKLSKRAIFERCVFTDLLEFWSVASSRRYCQRLYSDWQGNVQTGIMTIITKSGIKRWQWSMAHSH